MGISAFLALALLFPSAGTATTVSPDAPDAAVDDVLSVSGGFDATNFYASAHFRPGTLNVSTLGFILGLDTDLNLLTGVPLGGPLSGADVFVVFPDGIDPTKADVLDAITLGPIIGAVPVHFGPDSFDLAIPLAFLGTSTGRARFGLMAGPLDPVNPGTFDLADISTQTGLPAPGEGFAPLGGAPATPIPAPAPAVLLGSAITALAAALMRRRSA
jgi:hypothetical protein